MACCEKGEFEDYVIHPLSVVHNNTTKNIQFQIEDEDQLDGLVGASIVMLIQDVVTRKTIKQMVIGDGIDVVDEAESIFSVEPYYCDLAVKVYTYKITITYADGSVYKRVTGNYTVKN